MTGLNVAKGFPLPLVRPDSKDAFGELKDSEPGSGSIHGGKLGFASDLSRIEPVLELNLEALEHLSFDASDVSELTPTSHITTPGRAFNLNDKLFDQCQNCVQSGTPASRVVDLVECRLPQGSRALWIAQFSRFLLGVCESRYRLVCMLRCSTESRTKSGDQECGWVYPSRQQNLQLHNPDINLIPFLEDLRIRILSQGSLY